MYKVLVTGAGALLGQGIIRSLAKSSLPLEIVAVDPSPLAAGLYWAKRGIIIRMASDPRFLEGFEAVLDAEKPDIVFVGTDVELPILARNRDRLAQAYGAAIVVSSERVVEIANDKYLTSRFLRDNGFDAPDSCLAGEEGDFIERYGFPLVVKPRIGARSVGVRVVGSRDELRQALAQQADAVIQECVGTESEEYTAGTITFDGKCEASIVMRRDLRDGNTYRAFVEEFGALNDTVRRMAEVLGAFGPANFQFRLQSGRVRVFEINARFSGTTPLRALAGFPEVEMVLRRVLESEPVRQPELRPLVILRHWSEIAVEPGRLIGAGG